ncbi:MAG: DUF547 domain-containing protein [Alphaproteobacteria bacterium]|nr:DUF547 domain-containing protein [Alphaproteobacteria bacterium]
MPSSVIARRALLGSGLVLALGAFRSGEGLFAPSAEPWDRWATHNPDSTATVDHGPWDAFLDANLIVGADGINRIAYGRVVDRATLDRYLDALADTAIDTLARSEQLVFWINLYNALTVRVVLDHYPVASIRDIDIATGLFGDGPWDARLIAVAGQDLTLNDIEHRILRPLWRDARVHYAVNCAALGCPNLAATAYRGATAEAMLKDGARTYINHPRGVAVNGEAVTVSRIYDWYIEDFGGDEAGVIAHLTRYAAPDMAGRLEAIGRLAGTAYDWALSDAAA